MLDHIVNDEIRCDEDDFVARHVDLGVAYCVSLVAECDRGGRDRLTGSEIGATRKSRRCANRE